MKRFGFILAMLALVLAFSLAFAACDNGSTSEEPSEPGIPGTFTLTDIPAEYNGRYVYFTAIREGYIGFWDQIIMGIHADADGELFAKVVLTQISDGKAEIPLQRLYGKGGVVGVESYKGNDTFHSAEATVYETSTVFINEQSTLMDNSHKLSPGKFSNGSAKSSWNFGEEWSSNIPSTLAGSWFYKGQELFSITADGSGSIKGQGSYSVQARSNPQEARFIQGSDVIGEFTYSLGGGNMAIEVGTGPFAAWVNLGTGMGSDFFVITKQ